MGRLPFEPGQLALPLLGGVFLGLRGLIRNMGFKHEVHYPAILWAVATLATFGPYCARLRR